MSGNSISFMSSHGFGFNPDLRYIKSYFTRYFNGKDVFFRYYVNNERSGDKMANQGYKLAKQAFCENIKNIICIDDSLSAEIEFSDNNVVRILLAIPSDIQFKILLKHNNEKLIAKYNNFTHILPGSPFTRNIFESICEQEDRHIIDNVCLPSVWEINQDENQQKIREKFNNYFPESKGKKILALMLHVKEKKYFLSDFDIRLLLEKLGSDWFIVTNSSYIMEETQVLGSQYTNSLGFINRIMPEFDILYLADVLVTNNGRYATCFSSRHKPIFCPKLRKNYFEKYMARYHSKLFLKKFADLMETDLLNTDEDGTQNAFNQLFSYSELKCPYEDIAKLIEIKHY